MMSRTLFWAVGPSKGQSQEQATITSTVAPASRASVTISWIRAVASALLLPTLARLCPSAAETTYSSELNPAASARLAPLGLATSAENSISG
ncbi:Uncharacterised protein [Mycobacteroides abscessus]|nr:Uncharacterised protein [Mycobacteroides abscessus]